MGKNVEIRKLLPGKCDHLVGNFVFFNKEIVGNVTIFSGKIHVFPDLLGGQWAG